ncbi:MAG TPA: hypothetical protein VMT15_00730 [Bryobacteraceae bacterium]|nr:hypothetical protein [Bryobacteraceae bacterium]
MLERLTEAPVAPAGAFSVTVQLDEPGALTVDGEQVNPVSWTGGV